MYTPHHFALQDPAQLADLVRSVGAADLVSVGPDGTPLATRLPVLWDQEHGVLHAHFARANDHWRHIVDGARGLAVVTAAEAYISPSWYASKAEHGRVVPTWNYSQVQLAGSLTVHDDPDWLRVMVTRLTEQHESGREPAWSVNDAPATFVAGQLRAIVGVELRIDRVEAKAKLSQNRSEADRTGVVAGLRAEAAPRAGEVADAVAHAQRPAPGRSG